MPPTVIDQIKHRAFISVEDLDGLPVAPERIERFSTGHWGRQAMRAWFVPEQQVWAVVEIVRLDRLEFRWEFLNRVEGSSMVARSSVQLGLSERQYFARELPPIPWGQIEAKITHDGELKIKPGKEQGMLFDVE